MSSEWLQQPEIALIAIVGIRETVWFARLEFPAVFIALMLEALLGACLALNLLKPI
jgi:hypothetical protein